MDLSLRLALHKDEFDYTGIDKTQFRITFNPKSSPYETNELVLQAVKYMLRDWVDDIASRTGEEEKPKEPSPSLHARQEDRP